MHLLCMYVCLHVYMECFGYVLTFGLCVLSAHTCMYVCMYVSFVCLNVCMDIYVYALEECGVGEDSI